MDLLIEIAIFVLGAIFASFIGVVVVRLNTGQSFLSGRSRCDACNAPLSPLALVPIVSFFSSRGRAQCCGARLSLLAPGIETLLGGLFVLTYFSFGFSTALPFAFLSLALLFALVLYDLLHQILPPVLLYPFVLVSGLASFFAAPSLNSLYTTVLVASLIGASLAALHFLSRGRAMGFADAPLAFGLALLAGTSALAGFIFSFWIGAVVGIVLLARRPRGSRIGVEVPFAPFLAAGFLLALFTQWNPFVFALSGN